jgi:caa(3)-type oxidase subunit IV
MTTVSHAAAPHAEDVDPADHGHPADATYWKVALFLVVVTALEVSTYFWPEEWRKGAAVALVIMMFIKFGTVAAYFMHLKNDAVTLRRMFITGLALACAVYLITLTSFTFWQESGVEGFNDPPRAKPLPPTPTEVPASIPSGGGGH